MKLYFISALVLVGSCTKLRHSEKIENLKNSIVYENPEAVTKYSNTITTDELKTHLQFISSDSLQGRKTGELGHNNLCDYLKNYYISLNIKPAANDNSYFQNIEASNFSEGHKDSKNVLAFIEGSTYPNEILIISGHSDHLGVEDGEIFNGADDNGSGTSAILEMAEAFKIASNEGYRPKRSIAFMHFTGEEDGLVGSRFYTENPVFPIENTIANLNIDMIGRTDRYHENDDKYIYIIGADRLSTELHYISEAANEQFTQLELDYKFNAENESNRYYYRSDHYNFANKDIPVIFYFNGEHEDYHEATDTEEKINYSLLELRTKLIFATAWYLVNSEFRIIADKAD